SVGSASARWRSGYYHFGRSGVALRSTQENHVYVRGCWIRQYISGSKPACQRGGRGVMDYRHGLPWNQERGERRRLFTVALAVAPLFLIFAGYITWVELPERDRQEREALPPQLAKLIIEKKDPPKLVVPEREPKPEEKPVEQAKPELKPELKPEP